MIAKLMKSLHAPVYRRRMEVLSRLILPVLHAGDRVLDIGCGSGQLGRHILAHPDCPPDVTIRGLEIHPRDDCFISVDRCEGAQFPYDDGSFDVVIFADVLHHWSDQVGLAREGARVAGRNVIIKDHQISGFLAQAGICLIDWAANAPYGVPCLFKYHTPGQWESFPGKCGLSLVRAEDGIDLYPAGWNFFFGGKLQWMGILGKLESGEAGDGGEPIPPRTI